MKEPPKEKEVGDENKKDADEKTLPGEDLRELSISPSDKKEEKALPEINETQPFTPQFLQEEGTSDRLQDIEHHNREKEIEKHQKGLPSLAFSDIKGVEEIPAQSSPQHPLHPVTPPK